MRRYGFSVPDIQVPLVERFKQEHDNFSRAVVQLIENYYGNETPPIIVEQEIRELRHNIAVHDNQLQILIKDMVELLTMFDRSVKQYNLLIKD